MRLVQVALKATELEQSIDFYADLTGSGPTAVFDPPGLVFFDLDGVRLLLEREGSAGIVYLRVDDIHATAERYRHVLAGEPHVIFTHTDDSLGPAGTDEWQAFLRDPDGNLVGLVCWLPARP